MPNLQRCGLFWWFWTRNIWLKTGLGLERQRFVTWLETWWLEWLVDSSERIQITIIFLATINQKLFTHLVYWLSPGCFWMTPVELFISFTPGWSGLQQPVPEPLQGVPAMETSPLRGSDPGGRHQDCIRSPGAERRRITGICRARNELCNNELIED